LGEPETLAGHGALEAAAVRFAPYVALSDPNVWQRVGPAARAGATRLVLVESVDEAWLAREADALAGAAGPGLILGVGGGRVTDATKFVAWRLRAPFVLAPTNTASNAPFNGIAAVRRQGATFGVRGGAAPAAYVLDYALIGQAPLAVNRAGVGDMLLLHTMPYDWDAAVRAGRAPADEATRARLQAIKATFAAGMTSPDPVRLLPALLAAFRDHTALVTALPSLPIGFGSEHLFAWTLEQLLGREVLHGAAVALGALLMAQVQENDPSWVTDILARTRAPWQPERDLEASWQDVATALTRIADYNRATRGAYTVLDERPLDAPRAARLVEATRRLGPEFDA
jgi:glycerol-1-phosphate dehydrogenase [NAD(P)+]